MVITRAQAKRQRENVEGSSYADKKLKTALVSPSSTLPAGAEVDSGSTSGVQSVLALPPVSDDLDSDTHFEALQGYPSSDSTEHREMLARIDDPATPPTTYSSARPSNAASFVPLATKVAPASSNSSLSPLHSGLFSNADHLLSAPIDHAQFSSPSRHIYEENPAQATRDQALIWLSHSSSENFNAPAHGRAVSSTSVGQTDREDISPLIHCPTPVLHPRPSSEDANSSSYDRALSPTSVGQPGREDLSPLLHCPTPILHPRPSSEDANSPRYGRALSPRPAERLNRETLSPLYYCPTPVLHHLYSSTEDTGPPAHGKAPSSMLEGHSDKENLPPLPPAPAQAWYRYPSTGASAMGTAPLIPLELLQRADDTSELKSCHSRPRGKGKVSDAKLKTGSDLFVQMLDGSTHHFIRIEDERSIRPTPESSSADDVENDEKKKIRAAFRRPISESSSGDGDDERTDSTAGSIENFAAPSSGDSNDEKSSSSGESDDLSVVTESPDGIVESRESGKTALGTVSDGDVGPAEKSLTGPKRMVLGPKRTPLPDKKSRLFAKQNRGDVAQ